MSTYPRSPSSGLRFAEIPGDSESPELYAPGYYHPVYLGEIYQGRYRVFRKLGFGDHSTVWLARDVQLSRYVALKVTTADQSWSTEEFGFLTKLNRSTSSPHGGEVHIQQILDNFGHRGPNGLHRILVLEPMGRNLREHLLLSVHDDERNARPCLCFTREIARQLLLAVDYIHSEGVAHRDIRPENVLFSLQYELDDKSEEYIQDDLKYHLGGNLHYLRTLDGKPLDANSPAYIVEPKPLNDLVPATAPPPIFRVVLSGFGAASTLEDVNDGYRTPSKDNRPPEAVLGLPLSEKSDIWSLACVIFFTVTLTHLFCIGELDTTEEDQNDKHLQSMTEILGPLPPILLSKWERRARFVDSDGNLLNEAVEEERGIKKSLDELIARHQPPDMSQADASNFIDFMRLMLQFKPEDRPSAKGLLQHPWMGCESKETVPQVERRSLVRRALGRLSRGLSLN